MEGLGRVIAILVVGIGAGLMAVAVSDMQPEIALAGVAALCALACWLTLGPRGRELAVLTAFVFCISLKVNKTLLLEEVSRWQYVPFAGGAAGITIGLNDLAAVFLLVGALRRRPEPGTPAGPFRLNWMLISGPLLFMAAGVVSLHNADDHSLVLFELWRQALLLLTLVTAMNLSSRQLLVVLRLLTASVVLQGAIACLQVLKGAPLGLGFLGEQALVQEEIDFSYQVRAVGTIGHSNILAYFFELTLPLMLALLLTVCGWPERLLYLMGIGAALAGVFVTLSRAAWFAVPLTMAPVFFLYQGRNLLRRRGVLTIVGLAIVGGGTLAVAWPKIAERLFSDDAGSADVRKPLNQAAMSVIEQFPVFGAGLNNLGNSFSLYDRTHNARLLGPLNHVVHNLYLLVMAEVGLVGFLFFLWSLVAAVLTGWWLRRSPDPIARAIGVGGAAGLVAHMIHGLVDPGFKLSLPMSIMIAVQIGLIGAAWLRHRRALATASVDAPAWRPARPSRLTPQALPRPPRRAQAFR